MKALALLVLAMAALLDGAPAPAREALGTGATDILSATAAATGALIASVTRKILPSCRPAPPPSSAG